MTGKAKEEDIELQAVVESLAEGEDKARYDRWVKTIPDWDQGYLTVTYADRTVISYVHGKEAMRKDEWGVITYPPGHKVSAPVRGYLILKESGSESDLSYALGIEPAAEVVPPLVGPAPRLQSPLVVYGTRPTRIDRILDKSDTLATVVEIMKKINPYRERKAPHRVWDRRGQMEDLELYGEQCQKIVQSQESLQHQEAKQPREDSQWTEYQTKEYKEQNLDQLAEHNEQCLVVLTTHQLKEMQRQSANAIIYADPLYKDPYSTPSGLLGEEYGDEPMNEAECFGQANDADPQAQHNHLSKDLRKLLGPYRGFHVVPGNGSPELFGNADNLSAYYGMPLIEPSRNHKWELVGMVNMVEQEYARAAANLGGDCGDYGYENRDEDEVASNASSDCEQTQTVLFRPRSQLPGQALMLYLTYGGGLGLDFMAKVLAGCDQEFLFEYDSRWWKGYRIPQHTQLTDVIVEKVIGITKADKEWWQEENDPAWAMTTAGFKIPQEMVRTQMRIRERKIKHFAAKAIENYLWWRLLGETPNKDIRSGALMRYGEY